MLSVIVPAYDEEKPFVQLFTHFKIISPRMMKLLSVMMVIQDADLEYDPVDIPLIVAPI